MDDVKKFFKKNDEYNKRIPNGFVDSIIRLYDYNVMQEIKESLFHHNEERISKDLQNYLFASNYDIGEKVLCPYTNEQIEVTEQFFGTIEQYLTDKEPGTEGIKKYRHEVADKLTVNLQQQAQLEEYPYL